MKRIMRRSRNLSHFFDLQKEEKAKQGDEPETQTPEVQWLSEELRTALSEQNNGKSGNMLDALSNDRIDTGDRSLELS